MASWKLIYDGEKYWITEESGFALQQHDTSTPSALGWVTLNRIDGRELRVLLADGIGMSLEYFSDGTATKQES